MLELVANYYTGKMDMLDFDKALLRLRQEPRAEDRSVSPQAGALVSNSPVLDGGRRVPGLLSRRDGRETIVAAA